MSLSGRIDDFQRRHPATGYPLAVIYKFFDDQGAYLAAMCTYYAFISLFPLLLLFSTILGIVLADNPALQERILDSAMSQIPVIGAELGEPEKLGGGVPTLIIGGLIALYGGLGVAVAVQNAMNVIWAVPRNERPDPILVRLRGMVLLSTVGLAIVGLTVVNGFAAGLDLGVANRWFAILGSVILNTGVFTIAFQFGPARDLSIRDVFPGAFAAALCWQAIQTFGAVYVERAIANASATNGVFAIVLGLLAFLYVTSIVLMFCLEANVVRVDHLYPRSLLTPFTDNVILTKGDERAYSAQARAQRNKGFQEIDVTFDNPRENPDQASGGSDSQGSPDRAAENASD
ncbi:YihY/virulence factor BrkB family protein [Gordonia paraffinivorans]|uniref:YihY/virulence factor BrkB family protein n=1 Tax=Gordonia paraffinivorans TaxID=175628 RepID=UPI001446E867|nr:YihY/virulence factor BrkB family protein [Gordonia paraffinivorans]